MTKFTANTQSMRYTARDIETLRRTLDGINDTINRINGGVVIYNARVSLRSIMNKINIAESELSTLSGCLNNISDVYEDTERRLINRGNNISTSDSSSGNGSSGGGGSSWGDNGLADWAINQWWRELVIIPGATLPDVIISILPIEFEDDFLFDTASISTALLQLVVGGATHSLFNYERSGEISLKSSTKFKEDAPDYIGADGKPLKSTKYYDDDGNELSETPNTKFYDKAHTIYEFKEEVKESVSLYEFNYANDFGGELDVVVGEAEAHMSASAGLYVLKDDGTKLFSPGVDAEIGASVTAFEATYSQQVLGDEMLGLNTELKTTVGKAEAKADIGMQFFDENGKANVQIGASASAEAIAAEVEGKVAANVLGGEVGVTGTLNVGIGAHADVGYKDGVVKVDIGASLGVGASVELELDVGGMIDTAAEGVASAIDAAEEGWNDFKEGWNDFWDW